MPMNAIAHVVPKPRERTALSPFLMGDRVRSVVVGSRAAFDGEVIGVRGAQWLVLADDGHAWSRFTCELELITA